MKIALLILMLAVAGIVEAKEPEMDISIDTWIYTQVNAKKADTDKFANMAKEHQAKTVHDFVFNLDGVETSVSYDELKAFLDAHRQVMR